MKDLPLDEIVHLYKNEKMGSGRIAKKYGCCKATVIKRLREAKVGLRSAGVSKLKVGDGEFRRLYANERMSTRKIAEKLGCGRSTVHRKIAKLGIARDISTSHVRYARKPFSWDECEKAYLIGFAIGDLRVRKVGKKSRTIKIDCGSTKEEQIALIRNLFSKYGHVWVGKTRGDGKKQIEAFLDESFEFLLDARKKAGWALRGNRFMPFLAGLVDADGSIFISNNKPVFSIGNYDVELLELLHKGILERGIEPTRLYMNKKKYEIAGGYMQRQHYWHLRVTKKAQLLKLFNIMGPYIRHKKRKKDMRKAVMNIRNR